MTTCICQKFHKNDALSILSPKGAQLAVYNKRCPIHGFEEVASEPWEWKTEQKWFTKQEVINNVAMLRRCLDLRLVETSPDGMSGLLEWKRPVPPGHGDQPQT